MQRLRGSVYLQDGAIKESSLVDSRHQCDLDRHSMHLLVLNRQGRVGGCVRFYEHSRALKYWDLKAAHCALSRTADWIYKLFHALQSEVEYSSRLDLPCVEVGGWALDEELRGTTEGLRIVLGSYAVWQMMGNAVCLSTATLRNGSSSILRRIGGRSLEHEGVELPPYYDPEYGCQMELLKFYSWAPTPRYGAWVDQMKEELRHVTVVTREAGFEEIPQMDRQVLHARAGTA